jgi:shikimate dehydrogenase
MRTYGLIGKSLIHSFSKDFFTTFFEKEGLDAKYLNYELANIAEIRALFKKETLSGLNVTIPYKTDILPFLDEVSPEAAEIGAVNTVVFKNGKTIGYNTDAFGFHQSVKPFLTFHHERALILGTGGASKAVAYVLKNLGIDVLYISRNPKAENEFAYSEINKYMLDACKLIINCTPIGTFPNVDECPDFPFEYLSEDHLVVDLIYNPEKTKFLQKSEENGATILNGKAMLEQQALKAFALWDGE